MRTERENRVSERGRGTQIRSRLLMPPRKRRCPTNVTQRTKCGTNNKKRRRHTCTTTTTTTKKISDYFQVVGRSASTCTEKRESKVPLGAHTSINDEKLETTTTTDDLDQSQNGNTDLAVSSISSSSSLSLKLSPPSTSCSATIAQCRRPISSVLSSATISSSLSHVTSDIVTDTDTHLEWHLMSFPGLVTPVSSDT